MGKKFECLKEIIDSVICVPDIFRVKIENTDKFIFSISTKDEKTEEWYSVVAIKLLGKKLCLQGFFFLCNDIIYLIVRRIYLTRRNYMEVNLIWKKRCILMSKTTSEKRVACIMQ